MDNWWVLLVGLGGLAALKGAWRDWRRGERAFCVFGILLALSLFVSAGALWVVQ